MSMIDKQINNRQIDTNTEINKYNNIVEKTKANKNNKIKSESYTTGQIAPLLVVVDLYA